MVFQKNLEPSRKGHSILRQTSSEITLEIFFGEVLFAKAIVPMQMERIGCVDGALIVRSVNGYAGTEGGAGAVDFSETAFRRLASGELEVVKWSAQKTRSRLSGQPHGSALDKEERRWIFAPLKD